MANLATKSSSRDGGLVDRLSISKILVFILEFIIRLRLVHACRRILHHRCIGNDSYVVSKPALKCFLKVQMARSVKLLLCIPGCTNCKYICLLSISSFNIYEHSLSKHCSLGQSPLFYIFRNIFLYALKLSPPFLDFISSARMVLLS